MNTLTLQRPQRGGLLYDLDRVTHERNELTAILREALKEATDDLESGARWKDMRCDECVEGLLPLKYDDHKCWIHKARKLIGENHA